MATASTVSRKSSQLVGIRSAASAAMCPASVVGCCCGCACNEQTTITEGLNALITSSNLQGSTLAYSAYWALHTFDHRQAPEGCFEFRNTARGGGHVIDTSARTNACACPACTEGCAVLPADIVWSCGAALAKPCCRGSCAAMRAGSGTQAAAAAAKGAACCVSAARLPGTAERLRSSAAVTPLPVAPGEADASSAAVSGAAASHGACGSARAGLPTGAAAVPSCGVPSERAADAAPVPLTGAASVSAGEFVATRGSAAGLAAPEISGCAASAGAAADAAGTGASC